MYKNSTYKQSSIKCAEMPTVQPLDDRYDKTRSYFTSTKSYGRWRDAILQWVWTWCTWWLVICQGNHLEDNSTNYSHPRSQNSICWGWSVWLSTQTGPKLLRCSWESKWIFEGSSVLTCLKAVCRSMYRDRSQYVIGAPKPSSEQGL